MVELREGIRDLENRLDKIHHYYYGIFDRGIFYIMFNRYVPTN